jgi:hypothetical protein
MMAKKKQARTASKVIQPIDLTPLTRQATLADLRLLESTSSVAITGAMPPPREVTQTIVVGSKQDAEKQLIIAQLSLSLVGANADQSVGLRIEATFGLSYSFPSLDGITDEIANAFCRVLGTSHVWPYWREFVQSMIGRMGLPPFHVPLLRLDQLVKTSNQQPDSTELSAENKRKTKR